ncbi:glycosyltransferase family 2 protein [Nitrosomonas sp. JL21]|nr:glycosyltransferase family 2 protein [Nitrosomonas sp. JL21]
MTPSTSHVLLIPSYNPGNLIVNTVQDALAQWQPVWVVCDGSTDGSTAILQKMSENVSNLRVIVLSSNQGKGAAVMEGLRQAVESGFTHALTMDADGQHPAYLIPHFMNSSKDHPDSMILGRPVFDDSAPQLRVQGRKISNFLANLDTLWMGIGDCLYGFRVYPIAPLLHIMQKHRFMRRFDFDIEAAVRLCWKNIRPINVDAPVKYLNANEGGVSHFNYWRDNALLTWMHIRLIAGLMVRLPLLVWRKFNF